MKPLRRSLLLAGFFLLIFGAKLWLIDVAGSDLPTWDQWDGEGDTVLRPWIEGRLGIHNLVVPHNEHRLITTKLYLLGLFALNGQWDAFVETTANAIVHAFCAVALLLLARNWLQGGWLVAFGAVLILFFTLPFADDNTLVGFQVQFYFLLLFSLGHIGLTLASDGFSWPWGIGQLCGGLALATMASGFFSSAAVLAVLGYRLARRCRWTLQQTSSAIVAILFIGLGVALRHADPNLDELKARSVGQFIHGYLQLLAWPGTRLFPWTIVLFVPALMFAFHRVRNRHLSASEAVLAGLFCWVMLQFAATAYARGISVLTSRYLDFVAINVVLGFVFLAREFSGRTRQTLAILWLAIVVVGLGCETRQRWIESIERNIPRQRRREANVRAYVQTGDLAHLLNKPFGDIPFPDGQTLARLLRPPIQDILPPSVRRPVPLTPIVPDSLAALPPGLTAPEFATTISTWTLPTAAGTTWRSATQPATSLPVLRFRVAGDLGTPGRNLRLVVKSAAGEVPVVPEVSPGLRWKTVNVFRPPGEWWIDVADHDDQGWLAFTAPVEVGRWTWFSEKLLKHHLSIMVVGALALLTGGLAFLTEPRLQQSDGSDFARGD
jgi:hypothetical protein